MSNGDKIRSMTNWELAEFIYGVSNGEIKITNCTNDCDKCKTSTSWCISNIAEWLIEEAQRWTNY